MIQPFPGPTRQVRFVSFDGGVLADCSFVMPDRYRFWHERHEGPLTISRGAGLSYAAASFSARAVTIDHSRFNRILGFDCNTGSIEVEAGVTLGRIFHFLTPRGFFLPVQPGHPAITVGGCVAADVHGKNQFRDGTFGSQVRSMKLFHPSHGVLELSPERNPELFNLTCGGYGLTGHILTVELQAARIPSSSIGLRLLRVPNIFVLPELLTEAARDADLVFSWHDLTVSDSRFGQGWITQGSFLSHEDISHRNNPRPVIGRLSAETRGCWYIPFFNAWTTPLFNHTYSKLAPVVNGNKKLSLFDFIFQTHNKIAYFKLFGRAGFLEYQVIIPMDRFRSFIGTVKHYLARTRVPITLASSKLFKGTPVLLRFTGDGICLALNVPRGPGGIQFAEALDCIVKDYNCRPNIIKDSRLPAFVIADTYPEYATFRERLAAFDPKRLCISELSERLQI